MERALKENFRKLGDRELRRGNYETFRKMLKEERYVVVLQFLSQLQIKSVVDLDHIMNILSAIFNLLGKDNEHLSEFVQRFFLDDTIDDGDDYDDGLDAVEETMVEDENEVQKKKTVFSKAKTIFRNYVTLHSIRNGTGEGEPLSTGHYVPFRIKVYHDGVNIVNVCVQSGILQKSKAAADVNVTHDLNHKDFLEEAAIKKFDLGAYHSLSEGLKRWDRFGFLDDFKSGKMARKKNSDDDENPDVLSSNKINVIRAAHWIYHRAYHLTKCQSCLSEWLNHETENDLDTALQFMMHCKMGIWRFRQTHNLSNNTHTRAAQHDGTLTVKACGDKHKKVRTSNSVGLEVFLNRILPTSFHMTAPQGPPPSKRRATQKPVDEGPANNAGPEAGENDTDEEENEDDEEEERNEEKDAEVFEIKKKKKENEKS